MYAANTENVDPTGGDLATWYWETIELPAAERRLADAIAREQRRGTRLRPSNTTSRPSSIADLIDISISVVDVRLLIRFSFQ